MMTAYEFSLQYAIIDKNLRKLVQNNKFALTLQLLDRVQSLHKVGYIHYDIKPENICINGLSSCSKMTPELFLIDFGLSQRYLTDAGAHVPKVYYREFTGNLPFASLGACRLRSIARTDDFESVFYILIFLINDFILPWEDVIE